MYRPGAVGRRGATAVAVLALSLIAIAHAPCVAQGDAPKTRPELHIGLDWYTGWSDVDTLRRYTDGMWAGSSLAFPSVGYIRWEGPGDETGKLAFGIGEMYDGHNSMLQQPVEGWWRVPVGKMHLTFGKFYVPFAVQEWEWETKPGAMLQWADGPWSVAGSVNHNFDTHSANGYLRVGRSLWGDRANVGVSFGAGKGLSYATNHNTAWAGDCSVTWGNVSLVGEYMRATCAQGAFDSHFGKVSYLGLGLVTPYVATYTWDDSAAELGRFRASVYGANVKVNRHLAVESGWAATSAGPKWWSQLHVTWEM